MKPHITISVILVALFYLDATAQLVDRATFEQHRAAAHAITSSQRKATSAPITLTQNPFEIESFVMSTGHSAAEVKVYFNTSVMSAYRNECCPRVGEFELSLPTGYSVVAVTRGDDLQYVLDGMTQTPIIVSGVFDNKTNSLQFLAYGVCNASEMSLFPTGRIHYATLTIASTKAVKGNYTMTMSNAYFGMANEPIDFYVDGNTNFDFSVQQYATGIVLSKTSADIIVGNSLQLTATVTPNNTNNKAVMWNTSDAVVATVDENGLVTAKSLGTANITATTTDGSNLSASCRVTVTPQLATMLLLDMSQISIDINKSVQLKAIVLPENTTDKSVTWISVNPAVATVSTDGVVTAKIVGQTYIVATTADGSNLSATCQVNVTPSHAAGDINADGNVDGIDLNILIYIVLGDSATPYGGRADINNDGEVNGSDVNTLINILLGK